MVLFSYLLPGFPHVRQVFLQSRYKEVWSFAVAVILGSNIASLKAQRQLSMNTGQLSTVYSRLSSGQRINTASDDAAGLAIADSLKTGARLFNIASRNINDGISLLNITAGTLSNQKSILLRLKELAEQSANGVYSEQQRSALNNEYQALVQEFGRLGESASFNGQKLLLAGRGDNPLSYSLQVGVDGRSDSNLTFDSVDTARFSGSISARTDVTTSGTITPFEGSPDGTVDIDDFTYALNVQNANPTFEQLADYANNNIFRLSVTDSNGETRELLGVLLLGNFGGGTANQVSISLFTETAAGGTYDSVGSLSSVDQSVREADELTFSLNFENGATGSIDIDFRGLDITTDNSGLTSQTSIDFTGVETIGRALHALDIITARSAELSSLEGRLGAVQSRLETSQRVVSVSGENYLAAESRIRDADISAESSELVRLQILQQSSVAVLAQANIQPQLALTLLQQ